MLHDFGERNVHPSVNYSGSIEEEGNRMPKSWNPIGKFFDSSWVERRCDCEFPYSPDEEHAEERSKDDNIPSCEVSFEEMSNSLKKHGEDFKMSEHKKRSIVFEDNKAWDVAQHRCS
jgi:hypothetical protein